MTSADTPRNVALDGLRGIAILLVLIVHSVDFEPWSLTDRVFVKFAGGGWMGVDLFFVLSGFLITGILYDSRDSSRFWSGFYGRRVVRIFPIYLLYVAGLAIAANFVIPDAAEAAQWRQSQAWYWTHTLNLLIAHEGSWAAAPFNTGHFWSLAVEEQFYLLWPWAVRYCSRSALLKVCTGVVVSALALRVVATLMDVSPVSIFVLTPTRMDSLAMGAIAALLLRGSPAEGVHTFSRIMAYVGSALLTLAAVLDKGLKSTDPSIETFGLTGVAFISTALLLQAVSPDSHSRWQTFLRNRALVTLGKYSYALYLLHYLAIELVRKLTPPVNALPELLGGRMLWAILKFGLILGVSMVMAYVSWHVVEKRFLSLKRLFPYEARSLSLTSETAARPSNSA